jgi:hypothetical protein
MNGINFGKIFSLCKEMTLKLSPNADHCNIVACRTDIGLFKRGVSHDDQFDVTCCFLLPMVETQEVKVSCSLLEHRVVSTAQDAGTVQ